MGENKNSMEHKAITIEEGKEASINDLLEKLSSSKEGISSEEAKADLTISVTMKSLKKKSIL